MQGIKWLTVAALVALAAATVLDWYWVWGVLFLYWALDGIRSGSAFVVEPIERAKNPILFWIISAIWAGSGLWFVIGDLSWRLA